MKILSSYKDYYDYIVGIYGEDPILVLDRRVHNQPDFVQYLEENPISIEDRPILQQDKDRKVEKYKLWIGDWLVEFVVYNRKIYYGEQIKNIPHRSYREGKSVRWVSGYESKYGHKFSDLVEAGFIEIDFIEDISNSRRKRVNSISVLSKPIKSKRPKDLPDDIVISLGQSQFNNVGIFGRCDYPKLADLNLGKMIKPEDIYQMITDYLAELKLRAEYHKDTRTNVQKLEGKGFDKKTSFRPNMK